MTRPNDLDAALVRIHALERQNEQLANDIASFRALAQQIGASHAEPSGRPRTTRSRIPPAPLGVAFRDDVDAANARIAALERDNLELAEELAELRASSQFAPRPPSVRPPVVNDEPPVPMDRFAVGVGVHILFIVFVVICEIVSNA